MHRGSQRPYAALSYILAAKAERSTIVCLRERLGLVRPRSSDQDLDRIDISGSPLFSFLCSAVSVPQLCLGVLSALSFLVPFHQQAQAMNSSTQRRPGVNLRNCRPLFKSRKEGILYCAVCAALAGWLYARLSSVSGYQVFVSSDGSALGRASGLHSAPSR